MNITWTLISTAVVFFFERVLRWLFPENEHKKRGKNYVQNKKRKNRL